MENIDFAQKLVDYLNSLAKIDRNAITALIETRVPCNDDLANHPTVQCHVDENNNAVNKANVGLLGIINGFIGEGVICACYDDNWTLTRFELLKNIEETRFELKNIEGSTND